jgi:hypothetical protein
MYPPGQRSPKSGLAVRMCTQLLRLIQHHLRTSLQRPVRLHTWTRRLTVTALVASACYLLLVLIVPVRIGMVQRKPVAMESDAARHGSHRILGETQNGKLSAVVLFHNEYETLNNSLESWEQVGLQGYVGEIIFFLNGMPDSDQFYKITNLNHRESWQNKVRVVNSAQNLKLGVAILRMVALAKFRHVLLLEKDWALVEGNVAMTRQLDTAQALLSDDIAQVVRFRHRHRPGTPLHARIMHEGRESSMLAQQKNLLCYIHHWSANLTLQNPNVFSECPGKHKLDEPIWCSSAEYCQWTNNPCMFKKSWFIKELGEPYMRIYNATWKQDPDNNMLDFEFFTNWDDNVWNKRNFVVALPLGLFEHQEIGEQNLMNTVWYAWNRLATDVDEFRTFYLQQERNASNSGTDDHAIGYSIKDRFPVDFSRMYHYSKSMRRTESEAVTEIEGIAKSLREQLERGEGTWRHGITGLTDAFYKVSLFHYPIEPAAMNIVFVSALYNIAEQGASNSSVDEYRNPKALLEFREKLAHFASNLKALDSYQRVIYAPLVVIQELRSLVDGFVLELGNQNAKGDARVHFIPMEISELRTQILSHENSLRIRNIYQARNVSTPTETETGLLLSMAKPYLLHHAAIRLNVNDHATHYMWIDGQTPCLSRQQSSRDNGSDGRLGPANDHILRSHLLMKIFVTYHLVPPELMRGYPREVLLEELEVTEEAARAGLRVVDGTLFGGSRPAISLLTGYYDLVLRHMLRKGVMGSEREPLSIAMQNVGYNFSPFESSRGCRANIQGDHACDPDVKSADPMMCAIYRWALERRRLGSS